MSGVHAKLGLAGAAATQPGQEGLLSMVLNLQSRREVLLHQGLIETSKSGTGYHIKS